MKITPLELLLRQKIIPDAEIMRATGRDASTVWRWRWGKSRPDPHAVSALIALFGPERLDYNGCYDPSVDSDSEIPDAAKI